VALTTGRDGGEHHIMAWALGEDGELFAGPTPLMRSARGPLWVQLFERGSGVLALWASRRDDGFANIDAVELGAKAVPLVTPSTVADSVLAWQGGAIEDAVFLAVVRAAGARAATGQVELRVIGDGVAIESTTPLSATPTAQTDLDMIRSGDSFVLAWSDVRDHEPRVWTTRVDSSAKVLVPEAPASKAITPQSVLRLLGSGAAKSPVFLAWEDVDDGLTGPRRVSIAALDERAKVGPDRGLLWFDGVAGGSPELAASSEGVVALTAFAPCPEEKDDCPGGADVTLVAFDALCRGFGVGGDATGRARLCHQAR
jgi:hypothetical protein